jgi:hypothetical protein
MKVKNFSIAIGLLLSLTCSGASLASPGSWTPTGQLISGIIVEGNDDGNALVLIDGGVPASHIPSSCVSPYNTIPLNTDKGRAMYSLALAAQLAGKKVKLALACSGSRPLITHIWVL